MLTRLVHSRDTYRHLNGGTDQQYEVRVSTTGNARKAHRLEVETYGPIENALLLERYLGRGEDWRSMATGVILLHMRRMDDYRKAWPASFASAA